MTNGEIPGILAQTAPGGSRLPGQQAALAKGAGPGPPVPAPLRTPCPAPLHGPPLGSLQGGALPAPSTPQAGPPGGPPGWDPWAGHRVGQVSLPARLVHRKALWDPWGRQAGTCTWRVSGGWSSAPTGCSLGETDHSQARVNPCPSPRLASPTSPALPGRGVCRSPPNVLASDLGGSGGPRSSGFSSSWSRLPLDWEGAWSVVGRVRARDGA